LGLSATRARWTAAALVVLLAAAFGGAMLFAAHEHEARDAFADSDPPPDLPDRFYPPQGWSWGLVALGDGLERRYGVGAPATVAQAQILILPDYGETAETWFETARDLTGAGFTVWVLEGAGQGGSARLAGRRDLGHVTGFDGDVAAVRAFSETVIRPGPRRPLVLLGEGVGALVAARAVEAGLRPAVVILSAPDCATPPSYDALRFVGLGETRAGSGKAWSRDSPDDSAAHRTHDAWRGAVTHHWQLANPDLRMGGPSVAWNAALDQLHSHTAGHTPLPVPTVSLNGACLEPLASTRIVIPGAGPALELEDDAHRASWLRPIEVAAHQASQAQKSAAAHAP
jgi:lysophospholipase